MEMEVFLDSLAQVIERAKEMNVEISEVELVADNYYDCVQFVDSVGTILADIDFMESGVVSFYGPLR